MTATWDQQWNEYLEGLKGQTPARGPATTGEAWNAAVGAAGLNTFFGTYQPLGQAWDELNGRYSALTGQSVNDTLAANGIPISRYLQTNARALVPFIAALPEDQRRELEPLLDLDTRAGQIAADTEAQAARTAKYTYGLSGNTVAFVGDMARAAVDPVNLATMLVGATLPVGAGIGAVAKWLGREFLINAGVQAAQEPFVEAGREELGLEHGLGRALGNIVGAGVGGAAFAGILRAAGAATRLGFNTVRRAVTTRSRTAAGQPPRTPAEAGLSPEDFEAAAMLAERDAAILPADPRARIDQKRGIADAETAIEAGLRPTSPTLREGVAETRTVRDAGAPVAATEREATATVVLPDGQSIAVKSMLVELDDIRGPQHQAGKFDLEAEAPIVSPEKLVEYGGAHVASIREAYRADPEAAARYKDALQKRGYNVEDFEHPVEVRMREPAPKAAAATVRLAEEAPTPAARAARIGDELLERWRTGPLDAPGNATFVADVEAATGVRTNDYRAIGSTLVARVHEDPVLAELALSVDERTGPMVLGLVDASPELLQLKAAIAAGRVPEEADPTPWLTAGLREILTAREEGRAPVMTDDAAGDAVRLFFRDDALETPAGRQVIRKRVAEAAVRASDQEGAAIPDRAWQLEPRSNLQAGRHSGELLDDIPVKPIEPEISEFTGRPMLTADTEGFTFYRGTKAGQELARPVSSGRFGPGLYLSKQPGVGKLYGDIITEYTVDGALFDASPRYLYGAEKAALEARVFAQLRKAEAAKVREWWPEGKNVTGEDAWEILSRRLGPERAQEIIKAMDFRGIDGIGDGGETLVFDPGHVRPKEAAAAGAKEAEAGAAKEGAPAAPFREVEPEEFVAQRDLSPASPFLTPYPAAELGGHRLFLSEDGQIGYALSWDGDLQNVFRLPTAPKGTGSTAVVDAIRNGATTLDAFEGKLTELYARHGFKPVAKLPFNDEFAPAGWDYKSFNRPDVVFMVYDGGPRATLGSRVGSFPDYAKGSGKAVAGYDDAKAAQRSAVVDQQSRAGLEERAPAPAGGDRGTELSRDVGLPAQGPPGGDRLLAAAPVEAPKKILTAQQMKKLADRWVGGYWTDLQHAARAVVKKQDPKEYVCYDCSGSDLERYGYVQEVLDAVNSAPEVGKPLYRGIQEFGEPYKVGDVFSEPLATWTGDLGLAAQFASGHYAARKGDASTVLDLVESPNSRGLPLTEHLSPGVIDDPVVMAADEWLTSGQYRVTQVNVLPDGTRRVSVERIGPASATNPPRVAVNEAAGAPQAREGAAGPADTGEGVPAATGEMAARTGPNLPEDHQRYFTIDEATVALTMDRLVPGKVDGADDAAKLLAEAAAGKRRKPITVTPMGDGKFLVLEGNGAFMAAQRAGWKAMPVHVDAVGIQPHATLDEHYAVAPQHQETLNAAGREIEAGLGPGVTFKQPPGENGGIKVRAEADLKVVRKKYKSPRQVTDVVRAGFRVDSPELGDDVVRSLIKHFDVIDEGWNVILNTGYFDRKVLVRFPDGTIGEVQVWEPHLFDAKDKGGGQELYTESRKLPPKDPRLDALEAAQRELYTKAVDEAGPAWRELQSSVVGSGGTVPKSSANRSALTEYPLSTTSAMWTSSQAPPRSRIAQAQREPTVMAGRRSQLTNETSRPSISATREPPSVTANIGQKSPESRGQSEAAPKPVGDPQQAAAIGQLLEDPAFGPGFLFDVPVPRAAGEKGPATRRVTLEEAMRELDEDRAAIDQLIACIGVAPKAAA